MNWWPDSTVGPHLPSHLPFKWPTFVLQRDLTDWLLSFSSLNFNGCWSIVTPCDPGEKLVMSCQPGSRWVPRQSAKATLQPAYLYTAANSPRPHCLFKRVQAFAAQTRYWRSAGPTHSLTGRNHLRGGGGDWKGYGSSLGGLWSSPAPGPSPPSPGKCWSLLQALGGTQATWEDSGDRERSPGAGGAEAGERVKGDCCHSIRPLARQLSSNPDPLGGVHIQEELTLLGRRPLASPAPGGAPGGDQRHCARCGHGLGGVGPQWALGLRLLLSGACLCAAQVSCARV